MRIVSGSQSMQHLGALLLMDLALCFRGGLLRLGLEKLVRPSDLIVRNVHGLVAGDGWLSNQRCLMRLFVR